jgi:regulator of RNase E activity RraB
MTTPIDTLISNAQTFAQGAENDAKTALQAMRDDISRIGFTVTSFNAPTLPDAPKIPATLVAPTLDTITLDLPVDPVAAPVFQDIGPIDAGTAPVLTAVAPTLQLPTKPSEVAAFTAVLPGLDTTAVFPSAPNVNLGIDAPVIPDRASPLRPDVSLPGFDALRPTDLAPAPTDLNAQFIAAYQSAQPNMVAAIEGYLDGMLARYNPNYKPAMAAIEAQLAKYLAGGTALNPDVENAIYERSRSKGNADYLRTRQTAFEDAARRGFTLPDGALNSAINGARQAAADNNAAGARDIVVQQAEMEQKNLQFAVTTSTTLRQAVLSASISYHGNLIQINGQAIEYARNVLQALVDVYEAAVRAYGARVDAYRADAVVYETRLKSALAGIELYKADIQALEALTRVDVARIDVYKARIEVQQALVNIYRGQIDAIIAKMSVEKLKVEIFQAQVQGYSALVNAKQAEYQGYTAAIQGENAKALMYSEQVRGFVANVQAYQTTIQAKSEVVRAAATTNEARSRSYASTLAGYTAVVQARGEVARTKLENQRQTIVAFQATAIAQEANSRLQTDWYKSVASVIIENARLSVSTALSIASQNLERSKATAQLGTSSAQVYSQVASAAMSGINTLVSQQTTQ